MNTTSNSECFTVGALEDSLILVTFSIFYSIQEPLRPSMVSSQATMHPCCPGSSPGTSPRRQAARGGGPGAGQLPRLQLQVTSRNSLSRLSSPASSSPASDATLR